MEKKTKPEIDNEQASCTDITKARAKRKWRKPKLEDVSGKVMAQPYIRFT